MLYLFSDRNTFTKALSYFIFKKWAKRLIFFCIVLNIILFRDNRTSIAKMIRQVQQGPSLFTNKCTMKDNNVTLQLPISGNVCCSRHSIIGMAEKRS